MELLTELGRYELLHTFIVFRNTFLKQGQFKNYIVVTNLLLLMNLKVMLLKLKNTV